MTIETLKKELSVSMNGHVLNFDGKDLTMNSDGTPRKIGHIIEENGKIILRKREKEDDRYRVFDAWTINAHVLNYVDLIQYKSELRTYEIERGKAILIGKDVKGRSSVESKVAVPVKDWTILASEDKKEQSRIDKLGIEWYNLLKEEFGKTYFKELLAFVTERRKVTNVYPKSEDMFNAFKETPFSKVRVVILCNEPIKDELADGLALSYRLPFGALPEVDIVQEELERSIEDYRKVFDPLTWAQQGVLMLNQVLTSEDELTHEGRGWEKFTDVVMQLLYTKTSPIVFVIMGTRAFSYGNPLKTPAPHIVLSTYVDLPDFLGSNIFQNINYALEALHEEPIKW